jgi:putative copper export protein
MTSITVDSLHLLAASFWPAGLSSMAIYLARLRKSPELNAVTSTITERFSRMSLIDVPILALTLAQFLADYRKVFSISKRLRSNLARENSRLCNDAGHWRS